MHRNQYSMYANMRRNVFKTFSYGVLKMVSTKCVNYNLLFEMSALATWKKFSQLKPMLRNAKS